MIFLDFSGKEAPKGYPLIKLVARLFCATTAAAGAATVVVASIGGSVLYGHTVVEEFDAALLLELSVASWRQSRVSINTPWTVPRE